MFGRGGLAGPMGALIQGVPLMVPCLSHHGDWSQELSGDTAGPISVIFCRFLRRTCRESLLCFWNCRVCLPGAADTCLGAGEWEWRRRRCPPPPGLVVSEAQPPLAFPSSVFCGEMRPLQRCRVPAPLGPTAFLMLCFPHPFSFPSHVHTAMRVSSGQLRGRGVCYSWSRHPPPALGSCW